jgi:hypothetical protein
MTPQEEYANKILCLAFLLVALAFALCFAQVCRQRDEIARMKATDVKILDNNI